jgi:hypothetical protein
LAAKIDQLMHGCCVELDELFKLSLSVIWMCLSVFGSAEVGLPIDAKYFLIKIEKTCYSRQPQMGNKS